MSAPKGDEIYYCGTCGWVRSPDGFTGTCPKCQGVLKLMRCSRCMHAWSPRGGAAPRVCTKCKSQYWNRVRSRGKDNKNMEEDNDDN